MYSCTLSLTSALDGCGQRHAPAALPRPGTPCVGGWVGPRTGTENVAAIGIDPRTVQPLASRCTGYAIPAHVEPDRPQIRL